MLKIFHRYPYHSVIKCCVCFDLHMGNSQEPPFMQQFLPKNTPKFSPHLA